MEDRGAMVKQYMKRQESGGRVGLRKVYNTSASYDDHL